MRNYKYYIGIDTGVNTGLAIWDKQKKQIITIGTLKIHKALEVVQNANRLHPGAVFIRVEDARKRKWIPKQANEKAERGRAAGAGSVKRDASIWEDFLIDLKAEFEMVAPKNNKTKMDAELFKKFTGITSLTSEHARDAAMLVFGL